MGLFEQRIVAFVNYLLSTIVSVVVHRMWGRAMCPIALPCNMDYAVVTPETVFTIHRPNVDAEGRIVEAAGAGELVTYFPPITVKEE